MNENQRLHPQNIGLDEIRFHVEHQVADKLKRCAKGLVILAILRFVLLDFLWLLSDLCSALIVYFAYTNRTSLMAIFSLVNGIIGLIYAILKGISDIHFIIRYVNSNLFAFFIVFIFIYSVLVYSLVIIYSYFAYKIFRPMFAVPNYQQIPQGEHRTIIITNQGRQGFIPFTGTGRPLGTNNNL